MNKLNWLSILILLLILAMSLTHTVSAHRVHVESQINEIQIKSWYGGGESIEKADVKVYTIENGKEEIYIEGTTDEDGAYNFSPKMGVSEYRVVVKSDGHRGDKTINLSDTGLPEQNNEDPIYTKIISGFGYLAGLAGAGMLYMNWKRYNKGEEKNN
ncbi:hypothetical protein [Methanohalobium sp.]|uniref:hypothetical protein n=1 Tax=Methanohalobium sp. TaxID=2837493 RepID=UPI0025F3D614|nr:hypothetical protein [Methanohalobium sp.]